MYDGKAEKEAAALVAVLVGPDELKGLAMIARLDHDTAVKVIERSAAEIIELAQDCATDYALRCLRREAAALKESGGVA